MMPVKIKTWLSQFRKYYFTYSNGFYHLPHNGNSPEMMVDSLKGLPFVKHSIRQQCVTTTTPLMEGGFHYQKLEPGCWVFYSRMRYKANVAFDLVYDEDGPGGGNNEYYMLSLNNINNAVRAYSAVRDGHVCFPRYSWTLFKPRVRHCDHNFKGDNNRYITLFFNEEWLKTNLMGSRLFEEGGLDRFLQSEESFILWPLSESEAGVEYFPHFEKLMINDAEQGRVDRLQLKFSVLELIFRFFKVCKDQNVVTRHVAIEYAESFSVSRVENYLNSHLCEAFPGIDFLAEKFGLSSTRLKADFKQLYGQPVYQYFRARQMRLAKELLEQKHMQVKEISLTFGYQSQSKFSAAFKRHHGILPSEL